MILYTVTRIIPHRFLMIAPMETIHKVFGVEMDKEERQTLYLVDCLMHGFLKIEYHSKVSKSGRENEAREYTSNIPPLNTPTPTPTPTNEMDRLPPCGL